MIHIAQYMYTVRLTEITPYWYSDSFNTEVLVWYTSITITPAPVWGGAEFHRASLSASLRHIKGRANERGFRQTKGARRKSGVGA